ncbi:hypothetical protein BD410DRAFT_837676 [Rickenella mellea]|uniref:Uncharacterized protein n=1 Tax=Rickenella mellea TaxID=50990 RepID=A0A4Y7QBI0_9AGAM|nr:hypothetical protein BD410DRAFT_837676 [Rickenella mellea]
MTLNIQSTSARALWRQRPFSSSFYSLRHRNQYRNLFNLLRKQPPAARTEKQTPTLSQDDLFHPLSQSPFPVLRQRAEAIKKLAPCPVCVASHAAGHPHAVQRKVSFECPDCGWPTHCSEEHWKEDKHHTRYCGRLRITNEDEHDLRSGRKMTEFEMPGPVGYEETVSFANWDIFWYTRGFPSMDTERSRRHASKLLTFPITIASVLHQNSGLTVSNQRVTPEGARSLAALRTTLHPPIGTPETEEAGVGKPSARVFILGARAESSLPAYVWEQLSMVFPSAYVHVHFIGPQVSLPKNVSGQSTTESNTSESSSPSTTEHRASADPTPVEKEELTASRSAETSPSAEQDPPSSPDPKPSYLPNLYQPPTPAPIQPLKRTRSSLEIYGAPAYTSPFSPQLTLTGIQSTYVALHPQFSETFDPYTDCFFLFSPGFGFPSPTGATTESGEPLLQVASPTEWGETLPLLLQTKCPIFVTGFSPADVERDVRSLSTAPGVAGEFDWVITPGENAFGSEKWEVADFDPRVMVKTNWGIWGIRGKSRDIRERDL